MRQERARLEAEANHIQAQRKAAEASVPRMRCPRRSPSRGRSPPQPPPRQRQNRTEKSSPTEPIPELIAGRSTQYVNRRRRVAFIGRSTFRLLAPSSGAGSGGRK
jgi:hypothetical protein